MIRARLLPALLLLFACDTEQAHTPEASKLPGTSPLPDIEPASEPESGTVETGRFKPILIKGKNKYFSQKGFKGKAWLVFDQHGHASPLSTTVPNWRRESREWDELPGDHPYVDISLEKGVLPVGRSAENPSALLFSRSRIEVTPNLVRVGSFKEKAKLNPQKFFRVNMSGSYVGADDEFHYRSEKKSQDFAFGKMKVTTLGPLCFDTNEHHVVLDVAKGGQITFSSMRALIAFEEPLGPQSPKDLFVISHDDCAGWLRIFRFEAAR